MELLENISMLVLVMSPVFIYAIVGFVIGAIIMVTWNDEEAIVPATFVAISWPLSLPLIIMVSVSEKLMSWRYNK